MPKSPFVTQTDFESHKNKDWRIVHHIWPNIKGAVGPPGKKGALGLDGVTGPTGPEGDPGPQGATGVAGPTGPTGPEGEVGPSGPTGATGPTGVTGAQGEIGETGAQGPTGPTGVQGPQGEIGESGPTGPTGVSGSQGPAGDQGATGVQGDQGIQGITGPQGAQGATGVQGEQGIQGVTGVQGVQGITGVTGDEGPQGPTGAEGDVGPGISRVEEDFEGLSLGDIHGQGVYDRWSTWVTAADANTFATVNTGKYLYLLDNSSTGHVEATITANAGNEMITGVVEFEGSMSATNKAGYFSLYKGTTLNCGIRFFDNGQIGWLSNGTRTDMQAYSALTWYKIRIHFDCVSRYATIFINNVFKLRQALYSTTAGDYVNIIKLNTADPHVIGFGIDNLKIVNLTV